jgi:hypothetical protein
LIPSGKDDSTQRRSWKVGRGGRKQKRKKEKKRKEKKRKEKKRKRKEASEDNKGSHQFWPVSFVLHPRDWARYHAVSKL